MPQRRRNRATSLAHRRFSPSSVGGIGQPHRPPRHLQREALCVLQKGSLGARQQTPRPNVASRSLSVFAGCGSRIGRGALSAPYPLVLLSEGFCPLGHGVLKKRRCEWCDVKWRLSADTYGQRVTAERRHNGRVHGIDRMIPHEQPEWLVTVELEDALSRLSTAASRL